MIRRGLLLSTIGVVLGIAGAYVVTRYLKSLLFGVRPENPALLLGAGLRATRHDRDRGVPDCRPGWPRRAV